jgi:hypothetical protein
MSLLRSLILAFFVIPACMASGPGQLPDDSIKENDFKKISKKIKDEGGSMVAVSYLELISAVSEINDGNNRDMIDYVDGDTPQ